MLKGENTACSMSKLMPILQVIHRIVSNITLTTLSILIIIIAIKHKEFGA